MVKRREDFENERRELTALEAIRLNAKLLKRSEKRDAFVVRDLLDQGEDVNANNQLGFSALRYSQYPEIATLLIQNEADVHARDNFGRSALM